MHEIMVGMNGITIKAWMKVWYCKLKKMIRKEYVNLKYRTWNKGMDCDSLDSLYFVLSSLIVSEVRDGASRVRNGMPGSCPQVYLHLLYLECNILNIHRVRGIKLEIHGSNLETWRLKYTLFSKELNCLLVF